MVAFPVDRTYMMYPSSSPVSRYHRRAKTDRLDTELLKRAFLGWRRGEAKHCSMAAIPTVEDEDARRPGRERRVLVEERTRTINRLKANLARLAIRGFRPISLGRRASSGPCEHRKASPYPEGLELRPAA